MPKVGRRLSALLPRAKDLPGDALAGVVNSVVSVPSGMATAVLAGTNPIYGLYATVVSPTVGGLFASSQLMQIATTGASAIAAGQAIAGFDEDDRASALFVLVALSGLFLVAFGLLGAGRLVRYVSFPVMTGFLSGVAVVLVMDQAAQLAGYSSDASTSLGAFVDLLLHVGEFSWTAVLIGSIGLGIMIAVGRTPLANAASLFALVIPTVVTAWWQPRGVQLVSDISEIPSALPPFALPQLSMLTPGLVASSFAVAVVIAIQGAGVSQVVPNRDGSKADTSRDMLAQGVGNVAASFFHSMPTGASVSQSALNAQVGARSRFAMVFHGMSMLAIILLVSDLVGQVPMSALAAIMLLAGFEAIKFSDMQSIWRVGGTARLALAITFVATLVTSIPVAVGLGVVLSMVLFIYRAGQTIEVHELALEGNGQIRVLDAPTSLRPDDVTVVDAYGPLYFAAARTLRERLPQPGSATGAALVLRVRGNSQIGVTFIDEIGQYARRLAEHGGRLYLCGMSEDLAEKISRADRFPDGGVVVVPGSDILGESVHEAVRQARLWLDERAPDSDSQA